nr:prickle-like protein 4 isoform X2 [Anas platyrhynchos]XP_038024357.1 prickle-like protein 4 isoform X2 [Anas platyrhynchos]
MSLPSPAWPQPDEPPPCVTATGLPPASSDSDSGCALEEYLEPPADPAPPKVPACFESRSLDPASPADRSRLRVKALLQQLPPQDCDERYCPGLAEEERKQLRAFSARRRREALGQGQECPVPGSLPRLSLQGVRPEAEQRRPRDFGVPPGRPLLAPVLLLLPLLPPAPGGSHLLPAGREDSTAAGTTPSSSDPAAPPATS